MTTLIFSHKSAENHDMGHGHPECPNRIKAVTRALEADRFKDLDKREAPLATIEQISRIHSQIYVEQIIDLVPKEGFHQIDPDTALCPGSGEAAMRACGAVVAAIDAIMGGESNSAFCAMRPPGHHAEPNRGMGFCIFNNIAVGVQHARIVHNLERVAIVDFDVHHGNGTQSAFWSDENVFFASSHQYPFYPGTGSANETGVGNICNVPLAEGTGSQDFRRKIEGAILPALEKFQPQLIFLSAGFDAHSRDPLANLHLEEEDFGWITSKLVDIAGEHCDAKIISSLEGGYDLTALPNCVTAHLTELVKAM
ncbi:MAG: acetoin utilization protein [Rhodospirillaceae bacterium]|jgi:acetoin utilization deacetylase AcuC-like enzyme|nr:acetoin utilization protein [Rhodospirillaceae bacterium]